MSSSTTVWHRDALPRRSNLVHVELTQVFRPKWMPFCACGLVSGAYAFLLLALAVQAENAYQRPTDEALEQVEGLLTNVKVSFFVLSTRKL